MFLAGGEGGGGREGEGEFLAKEGEDPLSDAIPVVHGQAVAESTADHTNHWMCVCVCVIIILCKLYEGVLITKLLGGCGHHMQQELGVVTPHPLPLKICSGVFPSPSPFTPEDLLWSLPKPLTLYP